MKPLLARSAALAVLSALSTISAFASTFDLRADFSSSNNPNGVWSYGWSAVLGSIFHAYSQNSLPLNNGIDLWTDPGHCLGFPCTPNTGHNGTSTARFGETAWFVPGQVTIHPGQAGEYSMIRWTAPAADPIQIDATFTGVDTVGTTTDVHILHNGFSIFDSFIDDTDGFSNLIPDTEVSLHALLTVAAGDTIDFAVGRGKNGTYFFDATGIQATIISGPAPVPEPSNLVLVGAAMLGLVVHRARSGRRFRAG
jgi:hypothetical protein